MTDPRNAAFNEIHRVWLKPLGFRKTARKSVRVLGPDTNIQVKLESYPAQPGGPYRFSIEIRANWFEDAKDKLSYCLQLPSYVTKQQFYTISEAQEFSQVLGELKDQFQEIGLPAICKMESLQGVLDLFQKIPGDTPLFWYYESYFNLLNRLGFREESKMLLHKVIDTAPHEGISQRARNLLVLQEAVA